MPMCIYISYKKKYLKTLTNFVLFEMFITAFIAIASWPTIPSLLADHTKPVGRPYQDYI